MTETQAALDSFDSVKHLVLKEGPPIEVLNGVSLQGGRVVCWPRRSPVTAA